jgi:hypothetical protein
LFVKIIFLGCGKTTFVEKLLHSNRIRKRFKHIYYCYPDHFDDTPVDWAENWTDTLVTFVPYIPDINFFRTMQTNSLIVFDDNFDDIIKSPAVAQALKIHSRRRFSVIIISQMFFELGPFSRVIRNQLSGVVLFRNFGDVGINRRVATQLGALDQFNQADNDTKDEKFNPIIILSSEIVESLEMRVQTSYLSDKYSFCYK